MGLGRQRQLVPGRDPVRGVLLWDEQGTVGLERGHRVHREPVVVIGQVDKHLTAWLRGLAMRTSFSTVPLVAPSSLLTLPPSTSRASAAESPRTPTRDARPDRTRPPGPGRGSSGRCACCAAGGAEPQTSRMSDSTLSALERLAPLAGLLDLSWIRVDLFLEGVERHAEAHRDSPLSTAARWNTCSRSAGSWWGHDQRRNPAVGLAEKCNRAPRQFRPVPTPCWSDSVQ